jgi:hypothetical protein
LDALDDAARIDPDGENQTDIIEWRRVLESKGPH